MVLKGKSFQSFGAAAAKYTKRSETRDALQLQIDF